MGVANDAAAAPTGGDWRSQVCPKAREVMVKQIMKKLRETFPVKDSEVLSRLQNIIKGFEEKFYKAATSQLSYTRRLAMLSLYVEQRNQNPHCQAPGLPPRGNNNLEQSLAVSLMSQQQTQMPNNSTSEQAFSLPSLGQSLTGVGQTSAQNMSGWSTISEMQLMAMQSATQSGIQQNPVNIVQQSTQSLCQQPPQCVERHQQHPQLYLHQQPSLQQTQLPEQPNITLQQQLMGWQPNFHQNQLIHQQSSAVDMQQQHMLPVQSNNLLNSHHPDNVDLSMLRVNTENFNNLINPLSLGLASHHTSASEARNPRASLDSSSSRAQLGILENNTHREHVMPTSPEMGTGIPFGMDNILSDEVQVALGLLDDPDPLFPLHGIQDAPMVEALDFNIDSSPFYAEHVPNLFPGPDQLHNEQIGWPAILSQPASGTQMSQQNDWLRTSRLVAMEDPNNVSMPDSATNLKKRKFDGSSSSTPMFGQATSTPADDHTSAPAPPYPAIPEGASTTPSCT